MSLPLDAKIVLGAFTVSGIVHLVKPEVFKPLIPRQLPAHREIIVASGVAELVCAAGLALPATRRWAGYASAALLVGVFPGNVKMALDARRRGTPARQAATVARLPLQLPLIRGALRAGR
ncbi:hypothetical protein P5P86_07940 [Nocardioides sp. BP30]|uniref:DoxX family protein n=1 Tax=Nocardioides sp. BP30 TaxID=3036374 RepID=UPI0024691057|nr:hypothetical protein [Nocardioides sp. BP30]WGL53750.1 hypothetical protein P5P86_07940 [Nocardioides sp. BP30]